MTNEFKKVREGIFCFFLLSVQWTTAFGTEDSNPSTEPRAKLGETCLHKICEENLFCKSGHNPICQCLPGYKVYNNECIPSSGEFEPCMKNEDCCGHLSCINGICRKPVGPSSEFVTLAKICLGITVTTIIIAVFSSLIKCLLRYDNSRVFQRQSNTSSFNYMLPFRTRMINQEPRVDPGPDMYHLQDEKPPSYEECIRSSEGRPVPVEPPPPPPYIISTNIVTPTPETNPTPPSAHLSVPRQQQNLTPLNVQSLNSDINSNAIGTESSVKSDPDTTNTSSSRLK